MNGWTRGMPRDTIRAMALVWVAVQQIVVRARIDAAQPHPVTPRQNAP
jgi:hypothetical protein